MLTSLRSAISDYTAGAVIAVVLTALARRRVRLEAWSASRSLSA